MFKRLKEHLLSHILCVREVSDEMKRKSVDSALVFRNQLSKGINVPFQRFFDELCIGDWHQRIYPFVCVHNYVA